MRMPMPRLALGGIVLGLLLSGPACAESLDGQLAELVQLGQFRPDDALRQLQQLQQSRSTGSDANDLPRYQYAEGQIRLEDGDNEAAAAIAEALARDPQSTAQAQVLRAMVADRLGQTSEAALDAQRSLEQLNLQCKPGEEAESVQKGCDFRSAWQALRILYGEQANRGALVQAQATADRSLALAQAGHDRYLSLLSMGESALVSLEQGQRDKALQWLQRARQQAGTDRLLLAVARNYDAIVAARSGDKTGQLKAQLDSLDLAREAGATRLISRVQSNLADYYMHNGDPARALALSREALPVMLRYKDLIHERTLRHNMSVALLRLGQFEPARREIARVDELRRGQADTIQRIRELRELGAAWADAGQPREAIALFHAERQLTAEANARNRESSLQELKLKYDSAREQHDLDLLTRDKTIKDRQLGNRRLAQQVGVAVAVLLGLSLLLAAIMLKRVREANRKLKASQALLRAQSERDPLTDLANRRHFLAVMEQKQQLEPQARFNGALLMVDIDHFKNVNDEHGHNTGDIVICEVARRLSHAVRAEDLVVRWGGEEFLVFAPDVSQEQLGLLADRILHSVGGEPVATEQGPLRVTVSLGFAHFPLPPAHLPVHWEQAVNWADMALYLAKAQGRNRAMGIATVDAQDTQALTQIEADFEAACSSDRVKLTQVLGPA